MRAATIIAAMMLFSLPAASATQSSPERWESTIQALEEKLDPQIADENVTLFIGSSSIRLWQLQQSFPDLKTVNHGFGGSETSDSVHYFDRLVTPVRPERIVLYAGDNDIAKKKSPQQVHADFLKFVSQVQERLPEGATVFYIAIKPSLKRWEMRESMQQANQLIRDSCNAAPSLNFVDIWEPMIGEDGRPRPELFSKDGLHLNEQGYKLWNDVLRKAFQRSEADTSAVQ